MWRVALSQVGEIVGWPVINRPLSQVIRSIVRRSILYHYEDIDKVLKRNKGTGAVQAIDISDINPSYQPLLVNTKLPSNASFGWRCIMEARKVAQLSYCWKIVMEDRLTSGKIGSC
ncbi:hypothetical protein CMV_023420 [Castanea mollissima]|uniref:Uncharacterized protein n=1 Tax=Castanea mollissima TaxID=60419 RepID=A0A8J4V6X6_9ROSI|nr:hypothetical protein CMV_023420 [Castanea mollissima]